jgi:hypothetical protein
MFFNLKFSDVKGVFKLKTIFFKKTCMGRA